MVDNINNIKPFIILKIKWYIKLLLVLILVIIQIFQFFLIISTIVLLTYQKLALILNYL